MEDVVSDEIKKRWSQYEFIGNPIRYTNGKTYIRARYKFYPWEGTIHLYCVDDDWFWHDSSTQQLP